MRGRPTVVCVCWAMLSGVLGCSGPGSPNLLLVTVDTLRADRLACYGGESDLGLAICEVGWTGTRFERAFSTASHTSPSIASLLTSRYPRDHSVTASYATKLKPELLTVAEVLAEAGYSTAAFVSNPVLDQERGMDQGFDVYDDERDRPERNRPHLRERGAKATTDAALDWLSSARSPWFVWVHYQDPHGPYDPPGALPEIGTAGQTRLAVLDDHSGLGGIPQYQALPGVFTAGAYERRYALEIRYLDRQVRRLLAGADARGRVEIILTADHGEAFGEDGYWFAHGHSLGLDQVRVPLLWRPARATEPTVAERPVSTIDVAPTLVAAAGIDMPDTFAGLPLGQPTVDEVDERPIFLEHRRRAGVIVGETYYARDRRAFTEPVRDRISGGWLHPLPTRTAELHFGLLAPAYRDVSARHRATLEPLLDEFLSRPPVGTDLEFMQVDPATREALRSLGYLR